MRLFSHDFANPASQLAADEAIWIACERGDISDNVFRIWEGESKFVVLGRGSKVVEEVHQSACAADAIPILRRTSGGATILGGRGCLMYTVVLHQDDDPRLSTIDATHQFVLQTTATALNDHIRNRSLATADPGAIVVAGTSDLAWQPRAEPSDRPLPKPTCKVSGNSMRRGRTCTLYHGTLLYDFDLDEIGQYLAGAPRQPTYRAARDHSEFVTNLPLGREGTVAALRQAWQPEPAKTWPGGLLENIEELVRTKYSQESWNLRH